MPYALDETALKSYQSTIDQLWSSAYLRYPREVHLETATVCPAACTFCPYPILERKGNRMSDELIDKIIGDLEDVPRGVTFDISPFKVNEPFADRRIFTILAEINRRLPNALISLNTSAIPINERVLAGLMSVRRIHRLRISLNDHRAEAYRALMGVPIGKVRTAMRLIHEAHRAGRLSFPVRVTRVGDGSEVDAQFCHWVEREFPGFTPVVTCRGDWLGAVDEDLGEVPDVGCHHWFELSIMSTGQVALCCMDGDGSHAIGDVTKEHVLDVYNQPRYRALRLRARSRRSAAPCDRCTLL